MTENILIKSIQRHFFIVYTMIEKIIDHCPNNIWNKKSSGFIFWQQLLHTLGGVKGWLREERIDPNQLFQIDGKNISMNIIEFEKGYERDLTKEEIKTFCNEAKQTTENWFKEKDDEWLKSPYKIYNKMTNFDITLGQIKHLMYHIGHCEAIFRENSIKTEEYLDYYGEE